VCTQAIALIQSEFRLTGIAVAIIEDMRGIAKTLVLVGLLIQSIASLAQSVPVAVRDAVKTPYGRIPKFAACRRSPTPDAEDGVYQAGKEWPVYMNSIYVESRLAQGAPTIQVDLECQHDGSSMNVFMANSQVLALHDPKDEYEPGDRIAEVDQQYVDQCTNDVGEFLRSDRSFKDRFNYVRLNSAGSMDYSSCDMPVSRSEFGDGKDNDRNFFKGWKIGRKIYNDRDKGNFMWGCGMAKLKLPLALAIIGSNGNDFLNACKENPSYQDVLDDLCISDYPHISPCTFDNLMKMNRIKSSDLDASIGNCLGGLHWSLDSAIDQQAIREGYAFCKAITPSARPLRTSPRLQTNQ
jgi:hypothetical protein